MAGKIVRSVNAAAHENDLKLLLYASFAATRPVPLLAGTGKSIKPSDNGFGCTTDFIVPDPVPVARLSKAGAIASRGFVPYSCRSTYSVTGSMALSAARVLPGAAAADLTILPNGRIMNIVIQRPSGIIETEVEALGTERPISSFARAPLTGLSASHFRSEMYPEPGLGRTGRWPAVRVGA